MTEPAHNPDLQAETSFKNRDCSEFPIPYSPARFEWLTVLFILLGGLLFNLSTYNLYPTVWADEVLWSEPGINLIKTGSFTTSVWQFQPAGSFWAAQSPLYCFGVSGWMRIFGTDVAGARSFNLAIVSLAIFLVWVGTWYCRLISRPTLRILILPLLLTGYGLSFSYRCSRPDILGMLCLVSFGLSFFIRREKLRFAALFLCAFTAPWIGIQVALYTSIACALAWLFFKRVTLPLCIFIAASLFLGMASMLGFYHFHGVLDDLMSSISQAANEKQHWGGVDSYSASIPRRLNHTFKSYVNDLSCAAVLGGILLLTIRRTEALFSPANRGILYLLGLVLVVPIVFNFAAHFAFYYAYMIYVPSILVFMGLLDKADRVGFQNRLTNGLCFAAAAAACFVGLPLRLFISSYACDIRSRNEYATTIREVISPEDVVFTCDTAFFECKAVAQQVYAPMYSRALVDLSPAAHDFTEEEKLSITVLVVPVAKIEEMKQYWGGEWKTVSPPLGDSLRSDRLTSLPYIGKKMQSYFSSPQANRQPFQILRRSPAGNDSRQ